MQLVIEFFVQTECGDHLIEMYHKLLCFVKYYHI